MSASAGETRAPLLTDSGRDVRPAVAEDEPPWSPAGSLSELPVGQPGSPENAHDLESAYVNHQYTPEERQRLNLTESIDYLPPNSKVYRQWLRSQPHRRTWDRWFMVGSIGVTMGLLGYTEFTAISILSSLKFKGVSWLIDHAGLFIAWVFNVVFSTGLVALASWTVLEFASAAAGAGVAEVMAYLNGCHIPKIFNIKTLAVRWLSCACAVGAGLPVGPEGPMIAMGAAVGSGLSQGHSTTLNFSTGLFPRFSNPRDQRDFALAGAGIGVAVAFSAPIGGLLFAFEEISSFFSTTLGWQIFFGCMVSVLVLNTFRSAQALLEGGQFGLFDGDASTVFYEVQTILSNHVAAVIPAAVIGLVCGALSIVFTVINLKMSRVRNAWIVTDRQRRLLEPILFAAVFVTLSMLLPLAFGCKLPDCIIQQHDSRKLPPMAKLQLGGNEPACADSASPDTGVTAESRLEHYTCKPLLVPEGSPPIQPYNALAVLMDVPGEQAIRHLLSRGTHREFGYSALLVMLVVYFCGAAVIAGSAISSGLFVPMLLIGCIIGRLVGLLTIDVVAAHSSSGSFGIFLPPSPWAWLDPGVFALFGAGAFMGGTTRMTIALAVIMMEMSNDIKFLLPVMVAIMVAKAVADSATHPLYHAQLQLKAVPYLPADPISGVSLDLLQVRHLMASPVVMFQERMCVRDIRAALRNTTHNGFPVVRTSEHGQVFIGLVVRSHLMVLLRRALGRGAVSNELLSYSDLNRRYVSSAAQRIVSEQQMAVLQGATRATGVEQRASSIDDAVVDLQPYINTSAISVPEAFSAERAYILLRNLGLRHITVVDRFNRVKGMVTRKDLLGFKLDEAVHSASMRAPAVDRC